MARKRRKKKKTRRIQRGVTPHRQSLLAEDEVFSYQRLRDKLKDNRYRETLQKTYKKTALYPQEGFYRKEREAMVRRFTPDLYARVKEVRNFMESKETWICAKRKSRREGLFGSGSIGKNKVVSKLRRMTIDSLVDCKRR